MKNIQVNTKTIAASLILIMALGIIAIPSQLSKAQTATTIPTELFMSVAPNPIGVGQIVTATVWLSLEPPQYTSGIYYGWNFTVNIVQPSGSNITLGPFESSSTGGYFTTYIPTVAGSYIFQAFFSGSVVIIPKSMAGLVSFVPGTYDFTGSESSAMNLTVQSTPLQAWPQTPLPTGYWSFPISAENQNWYTIAGNWLDAVAGTGVIGTPQTPQLYSTGPNAPHILWTQPLTFGGISGGQYGVGNTPVGSSIPYTTNNWGINYYTGVVYQNKFAPRIVSGNLYYSVNSPASKLTGVKCVNLRTGATVWENDTMPQLTCAQVFTFQAGLQSGSEAFLWSVYNGQWQMYDAFTGRLFTTFINVPSGQPLSPIYGPDGEILVYIYSSTQDYIVMWNSTLAVGGAQTYQPFSTPTTNWLQGIQWNQTIAPQAGNPKLLFVDYADGVMVAEGSTGISTTNPIFEDYGYNDKTGALMWAVNRTNVGWGEGGPGNALGLIWNSANLQFGNGYYTFFQRETLQYHVVNIFTGIEQYVTQPLNTYTGSDFSYYDWSAQISDGILFLGGYSGCMSAFNVTTGTHLWTFSQINPGLQQPSGTWPAIGTPGVVCDGKLYWGVTQHTPGTPLFRGYNLYCINYTTGAEIWQIDGFFPGQSLAIADGELIGYSGYDNQIYAFGTGQSTTTVSVQQNIQPLGNEFQLQGTVTDQSQGTTAYGEAAGTPAIADAYQQQWMEYLYQQQSTPTNATGVPVTLTALDPNGNIENIGTTTSDITGHYAIDWTPPVPGLYTITASFAGTNSYYSSSAETSLTVTKAPAATTATTATPTSVADTYFVPAIAGLFVLIIIVAIVLALLMLRKKP